MPDRILSPMAFMISDVHVGDPNQENLEDFDRDADFARLLGEVIPARAAGPATLIIAGDFIDFPQILPELARSSPGDRFGATEEEAVARVRRATAGHPNVFSSLRDFIARGNQLLLLPGNHDIDLHFPAVLEELRAAMGGPASPAFEFVREGFLREKGVYIEHGNQYTFDNRFEHWMSPILDAPDGKRRVERPWGTLFMDIVYNDIENLYPFVNRVYPHAVLAWALLRSDTWPAMRATARLAAFLLTKGKRFLGEHLLSISEHDNVDIVTRGDVENFVEDLGSHVSTEQRRALVEEVVKLTHAREEGEHHHVEEEASGLLGRTDESALDCRAMDLLRLGKVHIVAFGHTHNAVDRPLLLGGRQCRVFNTGGWIPSLGIRASTLPSLADLRRATPVHNLSYLVLDLRSDVPRGWLEKLSTG